MQNNAFIVSYIKNSYKECLKNANLRLEKCVNISLSNTINVVETYKENKHNNHLSKTILEVSFSKICNML